MEKYRYVRIKGDDTKYFAGLDPYEKLWMTQSNTGFAIGALKEQDEDLFAVGLLCGMVFADSVSIEWMAVMPDERGRGIGESLLIRAFKMAQKGGLEKISVIIPKEFEKEEVLSVAHTFFEERLFTQKSTVCADVETTLIDLDKGTMPVSSAILPISEVDSNEVYKELEPIENATFSINIRNIRSQIDPEISYICKPEGKDITGGLLIQKAGNILIPVYHYARTDKDSEDLICACVKAAIKKYGKNAMVEIMARQEETKTLLKKVYGAVSDATMLSASIKDFDAEEKKH